MFRNGKIVLTLLVVILLINLPLPASTTNLPLMKKVALAGGPKQNITVIESTPNGLQFEIQIPWEQLLIIPVQLEGRNYVKVSIPGFYISDQSGKPSLPFASEALGVPYGAKITVQVIPEEAHTFELSAPVIPAVTREVAWLTQTELSREPVDPILFDKVTEDRAIYDGHDAFPSNLASIASDGIIRQQRVVGINTLIVQYQPDELTLTVFERLNVIVSFNNRQPDFNESKVIESSPYENFFREHLLNYEEARLWRQEGTAAVETNQMNEAQTSGAFSGHWSPPSPGWRIKVREDGIYKITYNELRDVHFPVMSLAPSTLQLFYLGNESAIYVEGEADGRFDPSDYIIFYGQAIDSKYTADNVYWLTYGKTNGNRMAKRDGTPGEAETPEYFISRKHMEENIYYRPYAPGSDDLERWLWDYVYPSSKPTWTHTFSLTEPFTGTAIIRLAMLGYIDKNIEPDHHVSVQINGSKIGDFLWDGITWLTAEVEVPEGILIAGDNSLSVNDPNDTGVGYDLVYIDWSELEYNSAYTTKTDDLSFRQVKSGTWKYQIGGFTGDQVAVFDITFPQNVSLILNAKEEWSPQGYTATFQDTIADQTTYWAVVDSPSANSYKTVQEIDGDTASDLGSTENGADYILITPLEFWSQAQTLTNYRKTQMRAVQVDIQDVYDEFGYGITGATAIRDFLAYAYANWKAPKPSYVVLLGDGHYDPINYLKFGRKSFIPPYLARTDPWIGETASDNIYVTVDGPDRMPDMMLGRLSINDAFEANAFISKIISYEQSPAPGEWQKNILAVTDNTDSAGNFAQTSDDLLICCLPANYAAEKIYFGTTHLNVDEAREAIQNGINAGKLIVNYIGHAYNTAWAQEDLFISSDVASLSNADMLPVILAMTCREGQYQNPDPLENNQEALGEVITRASGKGAIASWSPTGLGVAGGHDILNRGFLDAIFKNGKQTIGQATNEGKFDLWTIGGYQELLDTYILFGDPATEMILPLPEPQKNTLYLPILKKY
jgi:hypothetical protein